MHKNLKNMLFLCFISLVILITSFRQPKLYTELIINTHNNVDLSDISLFYTDVNYNEIKSYNLTPTGLDLKKTSYIPYSEGFIEKKSFQAYKSLFETNHMPLTSTFQNYYETESFIFFAFPGDLSTFRVLEKSTHQLHSLKFSPATYIAPMYVSHMIVVEDTLIILAGEARSYHALIYQVDLSTLEVSHSKRLETHPSALDTPHCTLTKDGTALWIAGESLQIYEPFKDKESHYTIPCTLTGITSNQNTVWAYSLADGQVKGILLNTDTPLVSNPVSISLPLPTPTAQLIDIDLKDTTLAVALLDPMASHFQQYTVLYDLSTHTMTYCLGIGDTSPLILTRIRFS